MAVPFDTLALARKLEAAGFPARQAQDTVTAFAEAFEDQIATKQDIRDVRSDLEKLEQRLTIKGALGLVALGTFLAAIKYFG